MMLIIFYGSAKRLEKIQSVWSNLFQKIDSANPMAPV